MKFVKYVLTNLRATPADCLVASVASFTCMLRPLAHRLPAFSLMTGLVTCSVHVAAIFMGLA